MTVSDKNICAIIPCLNEELVIGTLVLQVKKYVDHVIVVDDGSSDNTGEIAGLAGAHVVDYGENRGKAYAVRKGIEYAKSRGCYAVVLLDGDGQHSAEEIPQVLEPVLMDEADLVIGSRFLGERQDIPLYRRAGLKTLTVATNLSSCKECAYKCSDSQSGFRALGPKALENINFHSEAYNFESDMITHFLKMGLGICEVPISVSYKVPNKHKKNPVSHGYDVLSNIVGAIGYTRPLLIFGIPGGLLFIFGLISGSFVISEYYHYQIFHYLVLFISFTTIIIGLLLITSGLILNSLVVMMKRMRAEVN